MSFAPRLVFCQIHPGPGQRLGSLQPDLMPSRAFAIALVRDQPTVVRTGAFAMLCCGLERTQERCERFDNRLPLIGIVVPSFNQGRYLPGPGEYLSPGLPAD
jgi:hypothetical protein